MKWKSTMPSKKNQTKTTKTKAKQQNKKSRKPQRNKNNKTLIWQSQAQYEYQNLDWPSANNAPGTMLRSLHWDWLEGCPMRQLYMMQGQRRRQEGTLWAGPFGSSHENLAQCLCGEAKQAWHAKRTHVSQRWAYLQPKAQLAWGCQLPKVLGTDSIVWHQESEKEAVPREASKWRENRREMVQLDVPAGQSYPEWQVLPQQPDKSQQDVSVIDLRKLTKRQGK